jgi:hypothetical protein
MAQGARDAAVERERRRRPGRRRSGSNISAEEVADLVRVLVEIDEAKESGLLWFTWTWFLQL